MIIFDFIDNSGSVNGVDRSLHPGLRFGPWIFCFNKTRSVVVGSFGTDGVNPATDVITIPSHGLSNGDQVRLDTSDSLPGGLDTGFFYYVISAATDTFKLSLTSGGSAVDILDVGIGVQTVYKRGLPFDLTGWTVWAWVKDKTSDADTPLVLDLAPSIIAPSDGRVQIDIDDATSFPLAEHPTSVWDMIMSDPSGERYGKYVRGKFQILKAVTHPAGI